MDYLEKIRIRLEHLRLSVTALQAETERRVEAMEEEIEELEQTAEVLERLKDQDSATSYISKRDATVAQMISLTLNKYGPLELVPLVQKLQEDWRPDIQPTTVSTTLTRMRVSGTVGNVSGKWHSIADTESLEYDL